MKILHTSDLHLGISLHNFSLIEDQRYMLEQLILFIEEKEVEVVLISGDVFDHAAASSDAISLYNMLMTRLCKDLGVRVLIIAGNHDGAARLSSCSELLMGSGLYIRGKIDAFMQPVILKDTAFHMVPYFNIEEVRSLYPEEECRSYAQAMDIVLTHMREKWPADKKNVLLAHCYVAGAELSLSDRSALIGGSNRIGSDIFKGFDYVALGHLHKSQNISQSLRYSGSMLPYSTGEAGHAHSFTLLDTASMSREIIDIAPLHSVRVLAGTLEAVAAAAELDANREDYIKIELSDTYVHMDLVGTFRTYYPNLLGVTGKALQKEGDENITDIDQLTRLSEADILARFMDEYSTIEMDDELMALFQKSLEEVIKEGEYQ